MDQSIENYSHLWKSNYSKLLETIQIFFESFFIQQAIYE